MHSVQQSLEKRLKGWLTGSGNLLHPALHRHLQEGGPPHRLIRCPATGGQSHPRHTFSLYFRSPTYFCLVQKVPGGTNFVKCKTGPLKICSIGSLTIASRNNTKRGKSWVLPAVLPTSNHRESNPEGNANSGSC